MLITADDRQQIRIWDLRDQQSKQRIQFEPLTPINQILNLTQQVCVVTSRLNLLYFDEQPEKLASVVPIQALSDADELLVLTRLDIRCIDINTGQTKYLLQGYPML